MGKAEEHRGDGATGSLCPNELIIFSYNFARLQSVFLEKGKNAQIENKIKNIN